ncbi:hypothetical protein BRADI_3g11019v3 [Brachypodium distachyon]|uniref:Uncharacterized protein n=1 Tax=Brachypodium distachyon TaxID=15368 RepID=A0A0Q3J8L9_BRADI|nr:hypothetical protein BRADI_3g11019v3 [Brachypodium distachyon]
MWYKTVSTSEICFRWQIKNTHANSSGRYSICKQVHGPSVHKTPHRLIQFFSHLFHNIPNFSLGSNTWPITAHTHLLLIQYE